MRKEPMENVPYGSSISTRGGYVWCAYDPDGRLIAVAATAKEARNKYRRSRLTEEGVYGHAPMVYPSELEGRKDKFTKGV